MELISPDALLRDLFIFERNGKWIAFGRISGLLFEASDIEVYVLTKYMLGWSFDKICRDCPKPISTGDCLEAVRAVTRMLRNQHVVHDEIQPIDSFLLLITETCNMSCSYCFGRYHQQDISTRLMDDKTIIRSIDVAHELGAKGLGFFGGEPLLNFNAIKVAINHAEKRGFEFEYGMTTNGTLITETIADYLKEKRIRTSVGLDGTRESHDMTRPYKNGRSSFADVIKGIKLLSTRGILDAIEMTYSMKHPSELKEMINSVRSYCSNISCTCVDGRRESVYSDEIVRGPRLAKFYDECMDIILDSAKKNEPLYLGGAIELVGNALSRTKVVRQHICSGVIRRGVINVNGNVYPCPETISQEYLLGNIFANDFAAKFESRRIDALSKLEKQNVERYWFSDLVDMCIVRLTKGEDDVYHLEDADAISECYKNILGRLACTDKNILARIGSPSSKHCAGA